MRHVLTTLALASAVWFSTFSAVAQDYYPARSRPGQESLIQSSFNAQIALDESKDELEQQLEQVRAFYKMAAGSCAEAVKAVAESCEISRLTTNTRLDDRGTRGRYISVSGQITMKVQFKAQTAKGPETSE